MYSKIIITLLVLIFGLDALAQPVQKAKLIPSDRLSLDEFGLASDIWGNYAVVGSKIGVGGAAYIYKKNTSGGWPKRIRL